MIRIMFLFNYCFFFFLMLLIYCTYLLCRLFFDYFLFIIIIIISIIHLTIIRDILCKINATKMQNIRARVFNT